MHFRNYTRRFARRMDVNGWVRNLPDGSVEAIFEGEDESINEVLRLLTEEHPMASVDHLDVIWSPCIEEFSHFEIR